MSKQLNTKQLRAIELQTTTKLSNMEIADVIGINVRTLYNWQKLPEYIDARDHVLRASLNNAAALAVHTLIELLESRNDGIRLGAAREILDRGGFKTPDQIDLKTIDNIKVDWK